MRNTLFKKKIFQYKNIHANHIDMGNLTIKDCHGDNTMTDEEYLKMLADLRIQLAREEAKEERKILLFKLRHPIRYWKWRKTDDGKNYKLHKAMSKLMIRF